jgi:NADH dehydrogenase (ubiquinone) flavoprotein 1
MMNMMERFTKGQGHLREIDMLLEITYVHLSTLGSLVQIGATGNKSKVAPFVRWVMPLHGQSRVSCATSVRVTSLISRLTFTNISPGPEVERRITESRRLNGRVMFGGKKVSGIDQTLALPDNLGWDLKEPSDTLVEAPNPHA